MSVLRRATAVLAVSIAVGACASPSPSSTPAPTEIPSASAAPNASRPPVSQPPGPSTPPTPAPTIPASPPAPSGPSGITPDSYARVVTSDLRVRSRPEVSADSKVLEPLLQDGVELLVVEGPIRASGYEWFQVQAIVPFEADGYPFGWVAAAGKDGERWLEPAEEPCPPTPTGVEALAALNETEQHYFEITCFSRVPITFQARLGSPEANCGIEVPWGTDPVWFDRCNAAGEYLVPVEDPGGEPVLFPAFLPGIDLSSAPDPATAPETWPIVTVTGQFDHEAARTCRSRQNYAEEGVDPPDPGLVVLDCRTQFVVTSLEPVAG